MGEDLPSGVPPLEQAQQQGYVNGVQPQTPFEGQQEGNDGLPASTEPTPIIDNVPGIETPMDSGQTEHSDGGQDRDIPVGTDRFGKGTEEPYPPRADESGRIENVDMAHEMANAGDPMRGMAAEVRASAEVMYPGARKEEWARQAAAYDKQADALETEVGQEFQRLHEKESAWSSVVGEKPVDEEYYKDYLDGLRGWENMFDITTPQGLARAERFVELNNPIVKTYEDIWADMENAPDVMSWVSRMVYSDREVPDKTSRNGYFKIELPGLRELKLDKDGEFTTYDLRDLERDLGSVYNSSIRTEMRYAPKDTENSVFEPFGNQVKELNAAFKNPDLTLREIAPLYVGVVKQLTDYDILRQEVSKYQKIFEDVRSGSTSQRPEN